MHPWGLCPLGLFTDLYDIFGLKIANITYWDMLERPVGFATGVESWMGFAVFRDAALGVSVMDPVKS